MSHKNTRISQENKEQYKNLVTLKHLQAVFTIFRCSVTEIFAMG